VRDRAITPVQPARRELHRAHAYVNDIGCVPDQRPGFAVSVDPTVRDPEIVGADVFLGAVSATADSAAPPVAIASAVSADAATAETTALVLAGPCVISSPFHGRVLLLSEGDTTVPCQELLRDP